jgi:hypothetical protein
MDLFEKRMFLFHNRVKVIILECIFNCLVCDRIREDVVNELGDLNSIIKLSGGDLVNN